MFTPNLWRFRTIPDVVPEIANLRQQMNRIFNNIAQPTQQDFPAVNIWEDRDSAVVTAELPGIDTDKINIEVIGDMLTISGNREIEVLKEGETYLRQERGHGSFKRKIQLSFHIDAKKVEAHYEKGILSVTLPCLKEEMPKKIKIN